MKQSPLFIARCLGEKLNDMYFRSEDGEAVATIHLFGIKYASEIKNSGESKKAIAKSAGIQESYGTEICKGVKLSKYVSVRYARLTRDCTYSDRMERRKLRQKIKQERYIVKLVDKFFKIVLKEGEPDTSGVELDEMMEIFEKFNNYCLDNYNFVNWLIDEKELPDTKQRIKEALKMLIHITYIFDGPGDTIKERREHLERYFGLAFFQPNVGSERILVETIFADPGEEHEQVLANLEKWGPIIKADQDSLVKELEDAVGHYL